MDLHSFVLTCMHLRVHKPRARRAACSSPWRSPPHWAASVAPRGAWRSCRWTPQRRSHRSTAAEQQQCCALVLLSRVYARCGRVRWRHSARVPRATTRGSSPSTSCTKRCPRSMLMRACSSWCATPLVASLLRVPRTVCPTRCGCSKRYDRLQRQVRYRGDILASVRVRMPPRTIEQMRPSSSLSFHSDACARARCATLRSRTGASTDLLCDGFRAALSSGRLVGAPRSRAAHAPALQLRPEPALRSHLAVGARRTSRVRATAHRASPQGTRAQLLASY